MIFERGHFKSNKIQKAYVAESLARSKNFSKTNIPSGVVSVFLSHKHNDLTDEEELKGVIELLQDIGAIVYIDSMDNTLPAQTSGETALRIKNIIKHCDKFILLATEAAIRSYWCNWELGIGDVHKYKDHIAILPIKEKGTSDSSYIGNEYLQIYPSIDFEDGSTVDSIKKQFIKRGYYICNPIGSDGIKYIKPLKEWLN